MLGQYSVFYCHVSLIVVVLSGQCATYWDTQKHGVNWLSEGQGLGILPVERLQSWHKCLAQLLWLKD